MGDVMAKMGPIPIHLTSIVCLVVLGFSAVADARDLERDQLGATLLAAADGEAGPRLAVRWTGDPSARLSVWAGSDGHGTGIGEKALLDRVLLDRELMVFSTDLPSGLDTGRNEAVLSFRVFQEGGESLAWQESVPWVRQPFLESSSRPVEDNENTCAWVEGFHVPGPSRHVLAVAVFDDGGGPALFVGGMFRAIGDRVFDYIAKWDGENWHSLGSGVNGPVDVMTVHDGGDGAVLVVAGDFSTAGGIEAEGLATWDGSAWSSLGSGIRVHGIDALATFDDGSGPALVAAGSFALTEGMTSHQMVRWDGNTWEPLGSDTDGVINAMAVYGEGKDARLVIAGDFDSVGVLPAKNIAQWDGATWSSLGAGIGDNRVYELVVYDDGEGPVLVAAGWFGEAGGQSANGVAQWDGVAWSPLGSGLLGEGLKALAVYESADGPVLVAAGYFWRAGGVDVDGIAQWDGATWAPLGPEGDWHFDINALIEFDEGDGPILVAGGQFGASAGNGIANIARWDSNEWSSLGTSTSGQGSRGLFTSFVTYDSGEGPRLIAGGGFLEVGGVEANRIALWNGESWSRLGLGTNDRISDLEVYDDGDGPVLVAGGEFTTVDGGPIRYVAQWDGQTWSSLGSGVNGKVSALAVHDDGDGPVLVAGGEFTTAGGAEAPYLARWDGQTWASIGEAMNAPVQALVSHDQGNGPELFAGGYFSEVGGESMRRVARWDGVDWSPVGLGMDGGVSALEVFDNGTDAPVLVAGGGFFMADGHMTGGIAQWDGASWSAMGSSWNPQVSTLTAFDGEHGPVLVAAGFFESISGEVVNHIAQWDGEAWSAIGPGLGFSNAPYLSGIYRVASLDLGNGPLLVLGGSFDAAGGKASSNIAMYQCPERSPNLSLDLTNGASAATAGGTVTYHLVITNDGLFDLSPVHLSATFPEQLVGCRWSSAAEGDASGATPGAGSTFDQILDLPAGSSAQYVISCAVPAAAEGALRLEASASILGQPDAPTSAVDEDPILDRPNISTLILTHPGRMLEQGQISAPELSNAVERLDAFAAHTNVDGLVIDVGYHPELAELYALWDADVADGHSDPRAANRVLFGCDDLLQCEEERDGLHDLVRSVLQSRPDIEYLVLVGDDRIFPMARIPDFTPFPREIDYTPLGSFTPDLSHTRTTVGQALARNRYLSDDPIAVRGALDAEELEFPYLLLRPDLAVGRLVETPSEIVRSLDTFLEKDGRIDLTGLSPDHRVLVTGYDFLVDSAERIHDRWRQSFGLADDHTGRVPLDGQLISRRWELDTADERKDALLEHWTGSGAGAHRILNLNGHANHYEEGVPGENVDDIQGLSTIELEDRAPELVGDGNLIYAVGCHGGLPVPGSDPADVDRSLDLPQTLLGRGTLGYLANSGFGWGLLHAIGYSEKMMTLFTEELARPGIVTLGPTVLRTKQRYYLEDPFFGFTDIKTSLQWTLFGFPMLKIETGIADGSALGIGSRGPLSVKGEGGTECVHLDLPDHLECKAELNGMSDHGSFVKYRASGEALPEGTVGCPDPIDMEEPEGCYYALNGLTTTEEGWPIEPILIEDSRRAGTSQHGVLWTGGSYREESGWTPVLAQPISSGGPIDVAGSLPKTTFIRPKGRASGGALDSTQNCSPTDTELNTLVFVPAELVYDAALEPTIHRLHDVVSLEVFYYNNNEDGFGNCDRLGPEIANGPFHTLEGDSVQLSIVAGDDYVAGEDRNGVWRVVVVWDDETADEWKAMDLDYDAESGRFVGELEKPAGQDRIVYFVQAVDFRGNVSWVDYQPPEGISGAASSEIQEPGLPLPIEVLFPTTGLVFRDGFETGDTRAWSSSH